MKLVNEIVHPHPMHWSWRLNIRDSVEQELLDDLEVWFDDNCWLPTMMWMSTEALDIFDSDSGFAKRTSSEY